MEKFWICVFGYLDRNPQRAKYESSLYGIVAKLTVVEWCICMIMCALVLSLELVNTAVEAVVDLATEEKKPLAKIAKDTAAGAVLIAAIASVIVGLLIFVPHVVTWI